MDFETLTIQIIVKSGDSKSKSIEAIGCAKRSDIAQANKLLKEAGSLLSEAHKMHTEMIQNNPNGKLEDFTILFIHAQDHLMNAITIKDLAQEFIDLYEKINTK